MSGKKANVVFFFSLQYLGQPTDVGSTGDGNLCGLRELGGFTAFIGVFSLVSPPSCL